MSFSVNTFLIKLLVSISLLLLLTSCNSHKEAKEHSNQTPPIYPDYCGVTIPRNIAPLNFGINEATHIECCFSEGGENKLQISGKQSVTIDEDDWKNLLGEGEKNIELSVSVWNSEYPDGISYSPVTIHVSKDKIDPYIVYRLIAPEFNEWNHMFIKQRCLESFAEKEILSNRMNSNGCINCHCFNQGNAQQFMFHSRGKNSRTVIIKNGKISLANNHGKALTYPYWHPKGRYIVFTSDHAILTHYSHTKNKVEVYDDKAGLLIYDTQSKNVLTDERFNDSTHWETFPCYSPDGKYLYFCSTQSQLMPLDAELLKYSIIRVPFDDETGQLGTPIDTIYNGRINNKSASHPRISPDGNWLLFTESNFATFPIHHTECEQRLINLQTGEQLSCDEINSNQADSYHSWSSNGKWIVFTSRRLGRITRLFISHFENGKWGKPFLLPEKEFDCSQSMTLAYNVPEFVKESISIDKEQIRERLQKVKH